MRLFAVLKIDDSAVSEPDSPGGGAVALVNGLYLPDRNFLRNSLFLDEYREHSGDHRRHKFGVRVPPELFQRFDDRRDERHAAHLPYTLPRTDEQCVAAAGLVAVSLYPGPLGDLPHVVNGKRVIVRHPVGYDFAGLVLFNAGFDKRVGKLVGRRRHPVRLNEPDSQLIRIPGALFKRHKRQHIAAHQPVEESKLLQLLEIIDTFSVAVRRICEQPEFPLYLRFKLPRPLLVHLEESEIHLRCQFQALTDHRSAHFLKRRRGQRNAGIKIAASLTERVKVFVDIFVRRTAV